MDPLKRKTTVWAETGTHCRVCSRPFSYLQFRLKHHCRVCGEYVCAECSQHRVPVEGFEEPSRVCDICLVEEEDRLNAIRDREAAEKREAERKRSEEAREQERQRVDAVMAERRAKAREEFAARQAAAEEARLERVRVREAKEAQIEAGESRETGNSGDGEAKFGIYGAGEVSSGAGVISTSCSTGSMQPRSAHLSRRATTGEMGSSIPTADSLADPLSEELDVVGGGEHAHGEHCDHSAILRSHGASNGAQEGVLSLGAHLPVVDLEGGGEGGVGGEVEDEVADAEVVAGTGMTPKRQALAEVAAQFKRGDIDEEEKARKKISIIEEPDQCPICLDDLVLGRALYRIECGHQFHFECLKDNVVAAGKNADKCPVCRAQMDEHPCPLPCRHPNIQAASSGGVIPSFCPDCGESLQAQQQARQQTLLQELRQRRMRVQCPRCRMQTRPGEACRNCGASLPYLSESAGAVVRCPTCSMFIRIPGPVSPYVTYRCPHGHHFQVARAPGGGGGGGAAPAATGRGGRGGTRS